MYITNILENNSHLEFSENTYTCEKIKTFANQNIKYLINSKFSGGTTLLFVWDICFMHNWSKKIFYKLGLIILMMIKPWALEADNHRRMIKVLFDEPSNLYMKGKWNYLPLEKFSKYMLCFFREKGKCISRKKIVLQFFWNKLVHRIWKKTRFS